ncbi:MAG TPA: YihY/virulence factor BrkB family protein [Acidimicrobiales bacterium]|nr:YihY/virulence factor BrkB family protein [Acidimicrobiales bacterium]
MAGDAPKGPTDLEARSWAGVVKRTIREFQEDELTDRAAALTYYGVLAIFPALLALVSVLALIGRSATQPLLGNLTDVTPGAAKDVVTSTIENLQRSRGAGGLLFVVGLAGALWSASGYVAAFMRASNAIYEVEEGRPITVKLPVRLGVTIAMVVGLAVTAVAVVLTGGLAEQAGRLLGLGDTAVTAWSILKWPVLLVVVGLMFALLYWASPNVKQPGFRWISPGGLFAVVLWVVASGLFALYVANFASYNKTYGALGGVIVFLVWLWLTNVAILLGAELDAELERGRQIEAGHPADVEPFLEPRDTRKMKHPPANTGGGPDTRSNREGDAGNGRGRDGESDEQEGLEAWRERLRRLREREEAGRR